MAWLAQDIYLNIVKIFDLNFSPALYIFCLEESAQILPIHFELWVAIYMTLKGDYLQAMLFSESSQHGTQTLSKAF